MANTYRITDSESEAFGIVTLIQAASRSAAQEIYIDQCEAAGIVTGTLRIVRVA